LEPTVLTGVGEGMRCFRGETFGPVVAVRPYANIDAPMGGMGKSGAATAWKGC
jgi:acyl-CoA reductase-like NAD-dependent aldehyde dehydrogenase